MHAYMSTCHTLEDDMWEFVMRGRPGLCTPPVYPTLSEQWAMSAQCNDALPRQQVGYYASSRPVIISPPGKDMLPFYRACPGEIGSPK